MARTIREILGLVLRYGQRLLVYPAAFEPLAYRIPWGMPDIPYMAPLLKTPDGIDLTCYLFPQTRTSLTSSCKEVYIYSNPYDNPSPFVDERVELTEAAAEARATVIVFHGDLMHNYHCFLTASVLHQMKCNVFLLSYRGYGFSGGKPTEAGLRIDAQTALDYILSQPYLAHVPIIVCGHSLGGGVAIDLASRNSSRVAAVMVSNTFTSIPDIVRTWPIIGPLSFICTQKWRSIDKLRLIPTTTPILMISGRRDDVIPVQLMDKLWQAAQKRGLPRKSWFRWSVPWSAPDDTETVSDVLPEHDKFVMMEYVTHGSIFDCRIYFDAMIKAVEAQTQNRPHPAQANTANRIPDRRWRYQYPNVIIIQDPAEA
ncbi:Protein bem46 [Termitomyces sp. T112]|nr:Protein bem46 [Termitomyces sp. T112]